MMNKHLIEMGIDVRRIDQKQKTKDFIKRAKKNTQISCLDINSMDSDTLLMVGDFFGLDLITGTNIINTLNFEYKDKKE